LRGGERRKREKGKRENEDRGEGSAL